MLGEPSLPALAGTPALWTLFALVAAALVSTSAILLYHWRTFDETDRTIRRVTRLYIAGAIALLLAAAITIGAMT